MILLPRRLLSIAMAAIMAASLTASAGAQSSHGSPALLSLVANATPAVDPGPEPAVSEQDYVRFYGRGNAALVLTFAVHLKNGTVLPMDGTNTTFVLPDTAFTRWMIRAYAYKLNGIVSSRHGYEYPGDTKTGFTVPPYLNVLGRITDPTRSAVKQADSCDAHRGTCVFHNLPPGQYIAFSTYIQSDSLTKSESVIDDEGYRYVQHEVSWNDSYLIRGFTFVDGPYTLRDHLTTISDAAVRVAAAYSFDRGGEADK